jgi:hypothetical protein
MAAIFVQSTADIRKSVVLLEVSQASPACHSQKRSINPLKAELIPSIIYRHY